MVIYPQFQEVKGERINTVTETVKLLSQQEKLMRAENILRQGSVEQGVIPAIDCHQAGCGYQHTEDFYYSSVKTSTSC